VITEPSEPDGVSSSSLDSTLDGNSDGNSDETTPVGQIT